MTMTEFGRTAREKCSRGTDHGTASSLQLVGAQEYSAGWHLR